MTSTIVSSKQQISFPSVSLGPPTIVHFSRIAARVRRRSARRGAGYRRPLMTDEDARARSVAAPAPAKQDLTGSEQALESRTEELLRANGRLTLLARVAGDLILADAPQEHLKAAFDSIAAE